MMPAERLSHQLLVEFCADRQTDRHTDRQTHTDSTTEPLTTIPALFACIVKSRLLIYWTNATYVMTDVVVRPPHGSGKVVYFTAELFLSPRL